MYKSKPSPYWVSERVVAEVSSKVTSAVMSKDGTPVTSSTVASPTTFAGMQ